jgi:hypothetical protein
VSDQFSYEPIGPGTTATKEAPQPTFAYEEIGAPTTPSVAPPVADISSFMTDPVEAKQRATVEVISQQALSALPPYYAGIVIDALSKSASVETMINNWKGGIDSVSKQREIDALSFKQALGDNSPELGTKIKDLQAAQLSDPNASLVQNLVSGAGEQGAAGLRAGGMWLLGALSWPYRKLAEATGLTSLKDQQEQILSTVGEKFGLSQERTTAITSNPLSGLGESAKESTAGIVGPTYRQLVDQGTDPAVASGASFAIGGALTLLQLIPAGRLIPGAQRIGEEAFKAAVKQMVTDGTLLGLAKLWGIRVATIGAEQATLGMMNATTQVLGEEWARQYSNRTAGTNIPATSFADLTGDILTTAATQAAVGTAIGGVTAAREIRPTYEMGAKLRSWVDDVRAARARNVSPGAEPTLNPKALIGSEVRAAVDEAHTVMNESPTPEAVQQVKTRLDTSVDAILQDPTPETIPHAIEAARVSDAIEIAKTQLPEKPIVAVGDSQVKQLIELAKGKSGEISLPGIVKNWNEAVTVNEGQAQLWYNDATGGTHVVSEPVEGVATLNVQQSVKAGAPVEDATLQLHIVQDWARQEIDHRAIVRDEAIMAQESGEVTSAQEFSDLMKSQELPGQEKPPAWYESQWDNMDVQRASIEKARNDEFLNSLTKADLETTLKTISENPGFTGSKVLDPVLAKAKAGLSEPDFQSFVAEVAKNPTRYRQAIEASLDPEAAQVQQDRLAESLSSKVVRDSSKNELLTKYDSTRLGELTTSTDPEQQKAAIEAGRLVRAMMKPPSSALDYGYRVQIENLQDSLSLESGPKLRQVRERLRTYYDTHPEVTPDAETQALLNQKLSGDMTVKEIRSLAEQITEARDIGKKLRNVQRVNERTEVEADRAAIIKEVMAGKPFERTKDVGSIQQKKARRGNIARQGEAQSWSPLRIIDRLGPAAKRLYREVQDARDVEWRTADARTEPLIAKAKEFGIQPRSLAKIITSPSGKKYTTSDVLAMQWAMKDEGAKAHLIDGNGISEEEVTAMVKQLPSNVAEFGNEIAKSEGEESWNRLVQAFVEDTNSAPPPKVKNHFPIRVQDKQYDTPGSAIADDLLMRGGMRTPRVNKRMMLGRAQISPEHQTPMRLDGVALAFESIRQQEHYIASWKMAKRLKKVFLDDRNVRDAITQKYGNSWNEALASWINSFASPDAFHMTTPGDRFSNYMRGALTGGGIMFNLTTLGYNLTGPLMAMGDAGPRRLLTSLGKWMKDPKGMYERVTTALPQVKHASMDPVMNAMKKADPSTYRSLMRMTEELGYKPLELLDMWTRLIVADAVHQHAIDMEPNIPDRDAWDKARESIQRNQPSGEAQDLPMMYHAQSLKMFLVFSRQLNQIWNMMTADIPLEVKQGRMLQAIGSTLGIALSGFLIAMMGNKRLPKDAKEAAAWTADQFVVSVPFIGNTLEPLLIGKGYVSRGAEIIPGAQQMAADIAGVANKNQPMSSRIDRAVRTLIDVSRLFKMPAVAEKRVYDFLKTGDPWALVGGKPKK